jgi:macrolide-specific efflux system membrane fusion protein
MLSLKMPQTGPCRLAACAVVYWHLGPCLSPADEPVHVTSVLVRLIEEAEVPARDAGVLKAVVVREGDVVTEGQLVAEVDDREAQLARDRAELQFELARLGAENDVSVRFSRKSHEVAKAEHARALESDKKYPRSVSQSELEQLKLAAERAELEIEQAEHQLELARVELRLRTNDLDAARWQIEKLTIAAPISGVVAQVHRRQGEWVLPGEKVVRIVRTDRLRAEAFVDDATAARLSAGLSVSLSVVMPDESRSEFPGVLVFVSPEVDPVNRQVRIWAEIENRTGKLRPGVRAAMTIDAAHRAAEDAGKVSLEQVGP